MEPTFSGWTIRWGSPMNPVQSFSESNREQIHAAAQLIQAGGLVAFPTETVYGLGADAFNVDAVRKIFHVKKRPSCDPLIVHVAELDTLRLLVELNDMHRDAVENLTERFWPGPLTLVLPRRSMVPDVVTAGLPTVAIRMPGHPMALALIREADTPLAAPSANPFGLISPTRAQHVMAGLGEQVDCILDGGQCPLGVESTVLSLVDRQPRLLRAGSISLEDLEMVIGPIGHRDDPQHVLSAPGQMARHYATRTPLSILPTRGARPSVAPGEQVGLLAFSSFCDTRHYAVVEILSNSGDLREAARNLFAALHRLDAMGLDRLWAEPCLESGVGAAIMDRLRRCAVPESAFTNNETTTV